jgi:hypothetical protein
MEIYLTFFGRVTWIISFGGGSHEKLGNWEGEVTKNWETGRGSHKKLGNWEWSKSFGQSIGGVTSNFAEEVTMEEVTESLGKGCHE